MTLLVLQYHLADVGSKACRHAASYDEQLASLKPKQSAARPPNIQPSLSQPAIYTC